MTLATPIEPGPRPWRSARLGWCITIAALLLGVPPFLCKPPWNDVTLHDMAARSILRGGVHYRDIFDTNLPGIDWAMAAIRFTCGWSYETLRAWDFLIVAAAVAILAKVAKQRAAWFAAAVALWYPFTSEFNHCQRDVWMLLPAAAAVWLRTRQRWTIAEGFLWGVAVWFKPHVLIPAAFVWCSSRNVVRHSVALGGRNALGMPQSLSPPPTSEWRTTLFDLFSVLLGGLIAGAIGTAWLVATGAWPYFVDVFTNWNPEYLSDGIWQTLPFKCTYLVTCFQPWGLVHLVAIPMAVLGLRKPAPALAALYLGWIVQAVMLQKPFDYVQVPVLILGFAVLASRGWSVGFPFLFWILTLGFPTAETQAWPRCWSEGSSLAMRNRLGQFTHTPWGTNWEQLHDVEQFLRTVEPPPGDREITCWHDTTHPLYLQLDLEPSTRYMHFGTVFPLRGKLDEIRADVIRSPQRYVVSDLLRMTRAGGDLPQAERERFPWNQPVVFRSGRYVVHRIVRPPRPVEIDITPWGDVRD